ncbi:MAG: acetyl-CoA carboxylase carboxyltransferase subunit alpha [Psychrobacter sp.]|jgi:acetyl-CoA carboxylase carboxyl transferase subunit alpha|uniref:acetyl-CoA carboxylase carboxyltransferase subunit alpha n=1 Tax=Psychrobacter TaxID=497 RepID=UPI000429EB62|nr:MULTISPECIES: acetyl-CoA carboxylase carboxyltransferase subunit alpha [Psychrobacter]MCG3881098.1 acetyl-CoA carboxylase carboxyltransferase subunit alpha [Psychrobacter sp. Ps3]HAM61388.1 acetyl-CoA carboxylase carboxyltransferase subunit alpha [Psychrobacter sp.]|tara:strand:+ start:177 stop:980 length:804 start_codon:yes stop_codon:yes gene_type:complete
MSTVWDSVQLARHAKRPLFMDYVNQLFTEFDELHGDRAFADDKAILGGLARFNGQPVMVIGQHRGRSTRERIAHNFGMANPEGYRKMIRLAKMAERFNIPLMSFVDTQGAYPGIGAEERGQAQAIAESIAVFTSLKAPIIVTIIGEGGSGGALAIGVGDRVNMLQNSIYSVISPEGCASILWKTAEKAQDASEALKLNAVNLYQMGLIDAVIDEGEGAHVQPQPVMEALKTLLEEQLAEIVDMDADERCEQRYQKLKSFDSEVMLPG